MINNTGTKNTNNSKKWVKGYVTMGINYKLVIAILLGLIIIVGLINVPVNIDGDDGLSSSVDDNAVEEYDPVIDPSDFSSKVTNKYFNLTPGKKMVYEGQTEDGIEKIEFYVMGETRIVEGVENIIVWDRVWLDGELIEETFDWYAQDKEGNVWYFGEDSREMEDGKVVSTEGSWESGIDGARPGIIMKENPAIGDSYRQEYYEGEAEDMAEVIAFGESVTVPFGSFSNILKTYEWSPLEPDAKENKYYSSEAGGVILEASFDGKERVELVDIQYNAIPSP